MSKFINEPLEGWVVDVYERFQYENDIFKNDVFGRVWVSPRRLKKPKYIEIGTYEFFFCPHWLFTHAFSRYRLLTGKAHLLFNDYKKGEYKEDLTVIEYSIRQDMAVENPHKYLEKYKGE